MAYKFQLGGARLSGSLIQEGDLEVYDHSGASKAKISIGGAVTSVSLSGSGVLQVGGAATFAGIVAPLADNSKDLGSSAKQWKDLYVNGIGYIDQLGTDADPSAAYISSGEIDGTVIGGESAAAGTFLAVSGTTLGATAITGISLDLQGGTATVGGLTAEANLDIGAFSLRALTFTSDQTTGTAPFTVSSTTKVDNLNSDKLDGADWAAPAALGSTTPAVVSGSHFSGSGVFQIGGNSLFGGDIVPARDSAVDLGSSSKQFAEAHIDAGYIDIVSGSHFSGSGVLQIGGNAQFNATVMPARDSAQDLGSSVKKWNKIYVNEIVGGDLVKDVEKVAAGGTIASATDFALITSANGGTVTMSAASAGKTVTVKLSGGVGNLVLAAAGDDKIEAASSILLESTGSAVTLIAYDSVSWYVV
tara:strand:- start:106 stop:1356 length:1251 start_codon:yes stop_codon:yes gene_type:complete